jgi:hypothetical protein
MEEKPVEIKQVSEREIWVGENRMYLGEDNIFYITVVGEVDGKTAAEVTEIDNKFKSMVEGKLNVLADLNKGGKQSVEARKIWKEMTEDDRTGKIAMYGMHPVARVLASFVMGVSRKKDVRFFKTKEEALTWLKK